MNEAESALEPGHALRDRLHALGFFKDSHFKQLGGLWEKKGNTIPTATKASAEDHASKWDNDALQPDFDVSEEAPVVSAPSAGGAGVTSEASANKATGKMDHLHDYLKFARDKGASDIHICSEAVPMVRIHGKLRPISDKILPAEKVEKLLMGVLTDKQQTDLREKQGIELCLKVEGQGRYRTAMVKQRVGFDGAFRVVNNQTPTFESLGLPPALKKLTEFHQGLVLITGPNGCGKSATMAAMIDLISAARDDHIITIEDPVEIVFQSKRCQINQREVGPHTKSFSNALRAALREDPDVIMIGELRDLETVSLAITAAETGHLVFGTLHTTSAARTIDRVLDVFPPDEQAQVRSMISESIKGIVCQQLLPRKDGKGRALALEIMFNTSASANLIRERKMHQMASVMQTGVKQGMRLLDNSLQELLDDGVIEGVDAYFAADNKATFEQYAPEI